MFAEWQHCSILIYLKNAQPALAVQEGTHICNDEKKKEMKSSRLNPGGTKIASQRVYVDEAPWQLLIFLPQTPKKNNTEESQSVCENLRINHRTESFLLLQSSFCYYNLLPARGNIQTACSRLSQGTIFIVGYHIFFKKKTLRNFKWCKTAWMRTDVEGKSQWSKGCAQPEEKNPKGWRRHCWADGSTKIANNRLPRTEAAADLNCQKIEWG